MDGLILDTNGECGFVHPLDMERRHTVLIEQPFQHGETGVDAIVQCHRINGCLPRLGEMMEPESRNIHLGELGDLEGEREDYETVLRLGAETEEAQRSLDVDTPFDLRMCEMALRDRVMPVDPFVLRGQEHAVFGSAFSNADEIEDAVRRRSDR